MIAIAKVPVCAGTIQERFLQMLPAIREQASVAFRGELEIGE